MVTLRCPPARPHCFQTSNDECVVFFVARELKIRNSENIRNPPPIRTNCCSRFEVLALLLRQSIIYEGHSITIRVKFQLAASCIFSSYCEIQSGSACFAVLSPSPPPSLIRASACAWRGYNVLATKAHRLGVQPIPAKVINKTCPRPI